MNYKKKYGFTLIILVSILLVSILSIAWGSKKIPLSEVVDILFNNDINSFNEAIISERIPRTIFALIAGAALAVSGLLLQAITRNPVADPSILGVNAGASLFVVIGIAFLGISNSSQYIILAILGSFLSALLVFVIASVGNSNPSPIRLTLSGAIVGSALSSFTNMIFLPRVQSMTSFRFWQVGSLGGASYTSIINLLPFIIIGLILAFIISPSLEQLALGEEFATGLGVKVKKTKVISLIAALFLSGSITAIAGPIAFVGLIVPHTIRLLFNVKMNYLVIVTALGGSLLLCGADVIGRIILKNIEVEVGIITSFIGAIAFVVVVIKSKVSTL